MSGSDLLALSSDGAFGEALPLVSRHVNLLVEVARTLGAAASGEDAVHQSLRLLDRRLGARRSVVHGLNLEKRRLFACASHGLNSDQWVARFGRGVFGGVAESGRARFVARVDTDPAALSDLTEPFGWSTPPWMLLCVPLMVSRQVIGTLSAYFRGDQSDTEALLDLLEVVASLLAPAVSRFESPGDASAVVTEAPEPEVARHKNMIGQSPAMRPVYEQIEQVAPTSATVLIRGQSGCGKELVAQAIHLGSARAAHPFVKVNCAALPDALFESELFGHERGAFTGALMRKKGRFELAQGGTLFLDEIGELSLATQAKLLRVLQFREFERLGSQETMSTDVRVVTATNKDLEHGVRVGTFREDLYYRLNVFTIQLPLLRQRRPDIPALAEHFASRYAQEHRRPSVPLSSEALDALLTYPFPGNVRELENMIERAVVVCDGPMILLRHLPEVVRGELAAPYVESNTLADAVGVVERRMITEALDRAAGSVARAAVALGTTERVLRYKASRHGINCSRPRP